VKTDVEELSPTRVRLTVEVPFDELEPSIDHAYKEIGRQVRIKGFRPGHVPRQILDQRVGRRAVVDYAINEAVNDLCVKAVREAQVHVLGQPEVEITKVDDGAEMAFTAEVDVRPAFELPDVGGIGVVVDDADVSPDHVEEYLGSLRERFASLRGVTRPVQRGDYVSVDLSAEVDGQPVPDAQASGISYEVGSGSILDGLDDVLGGMSADESATFSTELAGGEHAGEQAEVTVTVRSVKVKHLPDLDDEFAQSASEFDTVGELRASTRRQMEAIRRVGQISQARDRVIEALIELVDIPLPDAFVDHEIEHRREALEADLEQAGLTLEAYARGRGLTEADVEKEISDDVRRSVKARFVIDQFAEREDIGVEQDELARYITQIAREQGVSPDQLARQLTSSGQLGMVASDVIRSKAVDLLVERVKITDASGRRVTVGEPAEADAEQAGPEQAGPEQVGSGQASTGQASTEQASGEQASTEQAGTEQAAARPKGRGRRSAKGAGPAAG